MDQRLLPRSLRVGRTRQMRQYFAYWRARDGTAFRIGRYLVFGFHGPTSSWRACGRILIIGGNGMRVAKIGSRRVYCGEFRRDGNIYWNDVDVWCRDALAAVVATALRDG